MDKFGLIVKERAQDYLLERLNNYQKYLPIIQKETNEDYQNNLNLIEALKATLNLEQGTLPTVDRNFKLDFN